MFAKEKEINDWQTKFNDFGDQFDNMKTKYQKDIKRYKSLVM